MMPIRSRHHGVIAELRAAGHLSLPAREILVGRTSPSMPADIAGRVERIHGDLFYIWLREFPVTTDRGEYVLLHEIAHAICGHLDRTIPRHEAEWEAEVWTMLRRPQWAGWIAEEMRPIIRTMCRDYEKANAGPVRWWKAMCLDVGYWPDFRRGDTWA